MCKTRGGRRRLPSSSSVHLCFETTSESTDEGTVVFLMVLEIFPILEMEEVLDPVPAPPFLASVFT